VLYNTDDIADQLKRGGALIAGVRPGVNTAQFIDTILSKLTFFGGLYLAFVAVLPDIVIRFLHIPMTFGGTSLLIAVVVVIEIMSQLQTYLIPGHLDRMRQSPNSQLKLLR
jgi:preprotein translocase subunit SecY